MFKKLKKLMSLTVLTAMILSLVGVMPVMAEEPEGLEPGIYAAEYSYVNSDGKKSNKLGMFAGCQSAAVVVNEDGTAYAQLIFWEDTTYSTNTLDGDKFVKNIYAADYSTSDDYITEMKASAPDTLAEGCNYKDVVKVFNIPLDASKIKDSVTDSLSKNTYTNAWQMKITYQKGNDEWSTGKYGGVDTAAYEAYIVLGSTLTKLDTLPTKQPAPTQTEATELKATILRTGNVSEEYIGTDFGKNRYRILSVKNTTDRPSIATVQIDGNYSKYYPGKYTDAENSKNKSKIVELTNTNKQISLEFNYLKNQETQTFSLYSDSMEKWVQYSISFEEGHSFYNGSCVNCGLIDATNTDVVKTTETAVTISNKTDDKAIVSTSNNSIVANKELAVETKAGSIVFDKDAVNSILAGLTTKATFEMKDATPADSKYDLVIELGFKDEAGKNVFAEGTAKGTAKITVPYAKTVAEGKLVKVYYINGDKKEEVEATYDAETKTITFTVAHFSTYAVEQIDKPAEKTEEKSDSEVANTGDASMMVMYLTLMLLASLAIVYSVKANRA